VQVHLEGGVEVVDYHELPDRLSDIDLDLPQPPRAWGPTERSGFGLSGIMTPSFPFGSNLGDAPNFRSPNSTWRNSGSVTIDVSVGDLRPEATFVTDDEESALVIFAEAPESVHGTWRATTRGYNEVFKGEVRVEVGDARNLTKPVRALLGLDAEDKDEDKA
jgi:hypothetical protein